MSFDYYLAAAANGKRLAWVREAAKRPDRFLRKKETSLTRKALNWHLAVQPAVKATPAFNPPARPPGMEPSRDKSLVGPTAKAVASPVALASQRK
jgi:hypothetical protein